MSQSLRPAITNWVWLAELRAMDDALVVGDYPLFVRAGLERHFSTITHHQPDRATDPDTLDGSAISLPFEGGTFDCVVVDAQIGEVSSEPSNPEAVRLLHRIRHVLRDGGCACFPVSNLTRGNPRRIVKRMRKAGFHDVRVFYVAGSLERPHTFVPVTRTAAAYFETFVWGASKGRVRAVLAATGLHHLLHPSMIVLAYR